MYTYVKCVVYVYLYFTVYADIKYISKLFMAKVPRGFLVLPDKSLHFWWHNSTLGALDSSVSPPLITILCSCNPFLDRIQPKQISLDIVLIPLWGTTRRSSSAFNLTTSLSILFLYLCGEWPGGLLRRGVPMYFFRRLFKVPQPPIPGVCLCCLVMYFFSLLLFLHFGENSIFVS